MRRYFTSNFRRFENCHRLDNDRTFNVKPFTNLVNFSCVCEIFEDLIFLMECMSYFIDSMCFRFYKFSILKSFFFEEETDIVCRFFKVLIKIVLSIVSVKNGNFLRSYLVVFDKCINLLYCLGALFSGDKVRDYGVSIFSIEIQRFSNHLYCFKKEFIFSY